MEIRAKEVSLKKLQKDAEDNFRGGYFCCEALVAAVRSNFDLDVPEEIIAAVSGMAVGIGRSGCTCGALNGGVAALGLFFGRTEPNGPQDPKVHGADPRAPRLVQGQQRQERHLLPGADPGV